MFDSVPNPQLTPADRVGPAPAQPAKSPARRTSRSGSKAPPSIRRTGYLMAWGVLALAAGAYVTAVVVQPKQLAGWMPVFDRISQKSPSGEENGSAPSAETQQLRATLEQAQSEVSRLRNELGTRDARAKAAELRIAGLETELQSLRGAGATTQPGVVVTPQGVVLSTRSLSGTGQVTDPAQRDLAAPPAAGADTAATTTTPRSFEIVNGTLALGDTPSGPAATKDVQPGAEVDMPLPSRRPAALAPSKPSPIAQIVRPTIEVRPGTPGGPTIETGSLTAPATVAKTKPADTPAQPITFGAPVVTRPSSQVGVRLTAGPSVDALRLSWSLMSERYGPELGGLQPRYVQGNTPAGPYALVAGPLSSDSDAQRVCGALIAKGIPCSVDAFVGNAL